MVRKEGFIDLDKIFKDKGIDTTCIDTIIESPHIKSMYGDDEENILLKFDYDNEIYYYKYNSFSLPYNELVANELARDFGFPIVEYDLAILKNKQGVISKNFRKDNASYIIGEELLVNFGFSCFDDEYHSLDNVWDALEYRYHNYPNKREIVEKLMNRVVSIFVFDILLCQNDRHIANWEIEELGTSIDIAPIYDNEMMLTKSSGDFSVSLTIGNDKNLYNNLKNFLKVSSENFLDFIKEKMWIINDENLESVFKRVEDKTGYPIPKNVREYYLKGFSSHRTELEKVLNNDQLGRDESNARKNK